jgi:hypothetical protein
MDDWTPVPPASLTSNGDSPTERARRRWGLVGTRTGVAVLIAGGLAAGSYGIASAATNSPGATTVSATTPTAGHSAGRAPHGGFGGGFGAGGPMGSGSGIGGTVSGVTASTITVSSPVGPSLTIRTNSATAYHEGASTVIRSAVTVGERVAFRFHPVAVPGALGGPRTIMPRTFDPAAVPGALGGSRAIMPRTALAPSGSLLATEVDILQPTITGAVVKIAGGDLTVADAQGFWRTVRVSSSTAYTEQGASASAAAVKVGTEIVATGAIDANHTDLDATNIDVQLPSVTGLVTAVSGSTITLRSASGTVTVSTDGSTVFHTSSGTGSITSVKTGDVVRAYGSAPSAATFSATVVEVVGQLRTGPIPFPGGGQPGRGDWGGTATGGATTPSSISPTL